MMFEMGANIQGNKKHLFAYTWHKVEEKKNENFKKHIYQKIMN